MLSKKTIFLFPQTPFCMFVRTSRSTRGSAYFSLSLRILIKVIKSPICPSFFLCERSSLGASVPSRCLCRYGFTSPAPGFSPLSPWLLDVWEQVTFLLLKWPTLEFPEMLQAASQLQPFGNCAHYPTGNSVISKHPFASMSLKKINLLET